MLELPKNRTLKGLLYTTTVAVVLCYAWLSARMLEPAFSSPPSVAVSVFTRSGQDIQFFEDRARELPDEAIRLSEELEWAAQKFQLLGDLSPVLRIVVELDRPDRLAITSDRIEIGPNVLRASGQLKKAVLKAWLLQKLSAETTASFLRLEVASDFLLAVLDGGLKLEVPGESKPLQYSEKTEGWWTFADNYQGLCKSPWRSLELQTLCDVSENEKSSVAISNLSFRPFLGQQLWESYLATAPKKREAFVRGWLNSLSREDDSTLSAMSSSLSELTVESGSRDWPLRLKQEMDQLLSSELDPRKEERSKWNSKIDAPLIVIDPSGRVVAPGTLKISTDEISIRKAKLAFITACEAPTLQAVVSLPVESTRVVWKPECAERKTDFIQARVSSVALALKRGLAMPSDRLDHFVKSGLLEAAKEKSDLLGFKDVKWNDKTKSFQVKGAIEAVEEFRLNAAAVSGG